MKTMNHPSQIGNYRVIYSWKYRKWHVKICRFGKWVTLEEFEKKADAIRWATKN